MANTAFLNGYTKRIRLTIDYTKIGETLTDFPVRVSLTSANLTFSDANSDGFDFRFTDSDGYTLLKYERELHDSVNSLAEYWVKIPSVSNTADTHFFLYYRSTDTADGADPENVWDTYHKMVQHMKDNTTSSTLDSTANNNDGTKVAANQPLEATGKISKGQAFTVATTDYMTVGDNATIEPTAITFSAVVYSPDYNASRYILSKRTGNAGYLLQVTSVGTRKAYAYVSISGTLRSVAGTNITLTNSSWHHIAATYDGNYIRLYIDGVLDNTSAQYTGTIDYDASNLYMGASTAAGNIWNGTLDEVRICSKAQSVHWLLADYHSCFDTLLTKTAEDIAAVKINIGDVWKDVDVVYGNLA